MNRERVSRWFVQRLTLLAALVVLASICAALAPFHWFLELFSHYALHYAAFALLLSFVLRLMKSRRWAVLAFVAAAWNVFVVAQGAAHSTRPDTGAGARLTVFHFNVGFRHTEPDVVVDYLLQNAQRFDVVVLIEAGPQWQGALRRTESAFPHSQRFLEESPFGILVLSRLKPTHSAIVDAPNGYRHTETRLQVSGSQRPVAIYGIHPPPPVSDSLAEARNEKLEWLARTVRGRPGEAAVVVGDFNLTPYSPYFATFSRESGLQAVQGRWLPQATWPVVLGMAWFGMPIDHSFVSPDLTVLAREIGPALGSDHLPVTLTLALR